MEIYHQQLELCPNLVLWEGFCFRLEGRSLPHVCDAASEETLCPSACSSSRRCGRHRLQTEPFKPVGANKGRGADVLIVLHNDLKGRAEHEWMSVHALHTNTVSEHTHCVCVESVHANMQLLCVSALLVKQSRNQQQAERRWEGGAAVSSRHRGSRQLLLSS